MGGGRGAVHIPWVFKRGEVALVEEQVLKPFNASIVVLGAKTIRCEEIIGSPIT